MQRDKQITIQIEQTDSVCSKLEQQDAGLDFQVIYEVGAVNISVWTSKPEKRWNPEASLTNLVLANVFQYLPYEEVARNSLVSRHWYNATKYSTSVTRASVSDSSESYGGALRWLAKRNGLHGLTLNVDTRKTRNPKLTGDIEAILFLLNGHAKTLEELAFYVPVDRFRISHSQTELMKLYAALQGAPSDDGIENDYFLLPKLHTFQFRQKWNSWKFCLPSLRNLSISVLRMSGSIQFDPKKLESLDVGAVEASQCVEFLGKCRDLRNIVLNVNEFTAEDMNGIWQALSNLEHLKRVVLLQFDDFEMKANEIFAHIQLPTTETELYYGLLDPTFHYEFDASQISIENEIHIYGENEVVNCAENVHFHLDHSLATFINTLKSLNVFCPNMISEIGEVDDQILEISDLVE